MLSVHLICVGKLKEKFYLEACKEYEKRLGGYCKLTLTELPEEKLPQNPTQGQIDQALAKEADAIRAKLPPSASLVALCVEESCAPVRNWPRSWPIGSSPPPSIWSFSSAAPMACTPPSSSRLGSSSLCPP